MAKSNAGKYVGVALVGAALGAVAGVLFAPRSGKATRRQIKQGAQKAERRAIWGFRKAGRKAASGIRNARKRIKLG